MGHHFLYQQKCGDSTPKTHTHTHIYMYNYNHKNSPFTEMNVHANGVFFFGARSQSGANVDAQTTKTDKSNRTHYHSTSVHFLIFNVHVNELESIYIYIYINNHTYMWQSLLYHICNMIIYDGYDVDSPSFGNSAQGPIQQLLVRDLQRIKLFNSSRHASARSPVGQFFFFDAFYGPWFIGPYQYWEGLNLLNGRGQ